MLEPTFVAFDGIRYEFGMDGFPAKVTLEGFNGRLINAAGKNFSRINLRLADGRTLIPFSKSAPRRTDLKKRSFWIIPRSCGRMMPAMWWRISVSP